MEFIINGIKSIDIDVDNAVLIRTDSQISRQVIGNKDIVEEKIPYNDLPIFIRTEKSPIEFDLMVSFLDKEFTTDKLIKLGYIFAKDKYVPFQSVDYPEIQFYVIAKSINLVTYGSFKGYYQIHMRTNAPYAWSLPQIYTFDLSEITSPIIKEIDNKSNVTNAYGENYYYPEVYIDLKSTSTGFTIKNLSDCGRETTLTSLSLNESIVLNRNNLRQVESSSTTPRLSNFNKNFLRLSYGKNLLQIYNKCLLQIKSQYPVFI